MSLLYVIWKVSHYKYKEKMFFESKKFFGIITQCKDEYYIKEFCDYYNSQGVDNIYIIDDDSEDKSIYNNISNDNVEIIYTIRKPSQVWKQMTEPNKLYNKIKNDFTWIAFIDVDEFIVTKKNEQNTIVNELKNTFDDCDCIKIPWVMMSSNGIKNNPKSVLQTNIYRWNHDKKHPNPKRKLRCRYDSIEVKCIFKPDKFEIIDGHIPQKPISDDIKVVNSINKGTDQVISVIDDIFYKNLREVNIKEGYLLCYHYRMISRENNINKIKNNTFYQHNFTIHDLEQSDYAEIMDNTLKHKSSIFI